MNQVSITMGSHPQSGKEVAFINILGQSFIYSDKRGCSTHTTGSVAFANEIIASLPCKVHNDGRMGSNDEQVRISWDKYSAGIVVKIHYAMQHVFSSQIIMDSAKYYGQGLPTYNQ